MIGDPENSLSDRFVIEMRRERSDYRFGQHLPREPCLPSFVLGPVLLDALRRLAAMNGVIGEWR
jgi:hypothetical protein